MLKVNEIFGPTIQGEGKSTGLDVMFIRLSLCNLHCDWCDTPYTWNWTGTKFAHKDKFDKEKELHLMSVEAICKHLSLKSRTVKRIVISGGEPMIQQWKLVKLLQFLKRDSYIVEVETNGTICPITDFMSLIDQVNCSPKLSNSGNTEIERIKPKALNVLSQSPKVFFKFVVNNETDMDEVWDYVNNFHIPRYRVYLMPLGKTKAELLETTQLVQTLASEHGFVFSRRLHVEKFGNVRGV